MSELTVADMERVRDLVDTLAGVVVALSHSHDKHCARLDAITVALVGLADATGHEINVTLGDVIDVFDRPDPAEEATP